MTNKHCYLFAVEVKPMDVGDIYEELPLHCTLTHRFWSGLDPEVLADKLKELHVRLYEYLNDLGVEYTTPEWVGKGYRAHVTERENARLELGSEYASKAVYLIEVKVPGHDHKRIIRHKFELGY